MKVRALCCGFVLDARALGALIKPLSLRKNEVSPNKFLESLRDLIIRRSQLGKRKLDRAVSRRELDDALRCLGERYRELVVTGKTEAPGELAEEMEAVRRLEERLREQEREIVELEAEHSTP